MRLLYVIVDELAVTEQQIAEYTAQGRRLCPAGDIFDVTPIAFGPRRFYESAVGSALCVPALLDAVHTVGSAYDAVIIGCFADPGLRAAREVSRVPVIGGGESAILFSQLVSRRFGIVTIEDSVVPELGEYVAALGLEARCVGINAVQMPFFTLVAEPHVTLARVEARAAALLDAGAESIVLGCMSFGFHPFAAQLSSRLGVPVLDGVRCAVAAAHVLDTVGVRHSAKWLPPLENPEAMLDFLGRFAPRLPNMPGTTSEEIADE